MFSYTARRPGQRLAVRTDRGCVRQSGAIGFGGCARGERKILAARLTAREFDWKVIAARYFQLIDTLHERGFRIEVPPLGASVDAWHEARKR